MILLFGGRFAEGYCVANDLEQAQSRVFMMIKRICEASPLLSSEAVITANKIAFPALGATITALASDYAGAAGGNPTITCFDELWAFTRERSRRLWDEMITSPARKISSRLTVTYAGFEGESVLLEEIYKRGSVLPEVAPSLRAGDGMLFAWHHEPIAPWQTESVARRDAPQPAPQCLFEDDREQLCRQRVELHRSASWDACVDPAAKPVLADRLMSVWIGVDASVKHDSTAIVAVTWDDDRPRLVAHRVFQPQPDDPIDFEFTVERTLLDFNKRFCVQKVLFDPYMLHPVMQRLTREGIDVEEFPQTTGNLTDASQNLFEVIRGRNIVVYPAADIRLAICRAIAIETSRGWRIAKDKQSHKIDVVVALAMAALACMRAQSESSYDISMRWAV